MTYIPLYSLGFPFVYAVQDLLCQLEIVATLELTILINNKKIVYFKNKTKNWIKENILTGWPVNFKFRDLGLFRRILKNILEKIGINAEKMYYYFRRIKILLPRISACNTKL